MGFSHHDTIFLTLPQSRGLLLKGPAAAHDGAMRILGVDPGLATVGIGMIEADGPDRLSDPDWCAITTEAGLPLAERLLEIQSDLKALVADFQPELAVVERLFFAVNTQSALEVAQARGVILAVLAEAGITVLEPAPLELKLAITGDGQAEKGQMQAMVATILKLDEIPTPADAADGLALAIFGASQSALGDGIPRR